MKAIKIIETLNGEVNDKAFSRREAFNKGIHSRYEGSFLRLFHWPCC